MNLKVVAMVLCLGVLGLNIAFKSPLDRKQIQETAANLLEARMMTGQPAHDFGVDLVGGGRFALSDNVGRQVVILNFFATWCGPCREEIPELNQYASSLIGKKAVMIGIDVSETEPTLSAFLHDVKVSYPVGRDADGKIAASYGVKAYPTTIVIGADGRIALVESGAIANAELTLGEPVGKGLASIAAGKGISREAFLSLPKRVVPSPTPDAEGLTGRALAIATKAPCPCGCSDTVLTCGCQTAKSIMKKLKTENLEGRDDAQIIQEIGREFCKRMS